MATEVQLPDSYPMSCSGRSMGPLRAADQASERQRRALAKPLHTRRGPRPLALHIAHAEWAWRTEDPSRLAHFFHGIKAYRQHRYRRINNLPPAVWQAGTTLLRDYGPRDGWPLLVVPSLINRAYVLDLMPGASLLTFLRDGGIRPLLLDWSEPAGDDRRLSLDDYILGRLEPAFDWLLRETGKRPLILGYCMGGTLATALACMRAGDLAGLALLATPWDFHDGEPNVRRLASRHHTLSRYSGMVGSAPVDLLQSLFAAIDPMAVPRKFARFSLLQPTSAEATRFVAIEDWLNDGVPLAADLATSCFLNWYSDNAPARGQWKVAGFPVQPERLDLPAYLAIPTKDRIVPAGSALALASALPGAETIRPASGHVGMVAGRNARHELWTPLLAWLQRIAAMQKKPW